MPSKWFKRTNCKILHLRFLDFFRLSENDIKKKERWDSIHAVSDNCNYAFNESDYATLHSIMNIMTENGAKMMHKMP